MQEDLDFGGNCNRMGANSLVPIPWRPVLFAN
jgi:hypothetical protein